MFVKRSCEGGPEPKRTRYLGIEEDSILDSESTINENHQLDSVFVKLEPPYIEPTESLSDFESTEILSNNESTEILTQFPMVTIKSEPSDAFIDEDDPILDSSAIKLECSVNPKEMFYKMNESLGKILHPLQKSSLSTEIQEEQADEDGNLYCIVNINKDLLENNKTDECNNFGDNYRINCYRCFRHNIPLKEFANHLNITHKVSDTNSELRSFLAVIAFDQRHHHQCCLCNKDLALIDCEPHLRSDHQICRFCQVPRSKSRITHKSCDTLFTHVYHCKICDREVIWEDAMLKHFSSEHPASNLNFLTISREAFGIGCPYCFYCSSNIKSVKFHVNLHKRKKCVSCQRSFLPTLRHIGNSQLVQCLDCVHKSSGSRSSTQIQPVVPETISRNVTLEQPKTFSNGVAKIQPHTTNLVSRKLAMSKEELLVSGKEVPVVSAQKCNDATQIKPPDISFKTLSKEEILTLGKPTIVLSSKSNSNATQIPSCDIVSKTLSKKEILTSGKPTIVLTSKSDNNITKIQPESSGTATHQKICIIKGANPKAISIISNGKKLTFVPKVVGSNPESTKSQDITEPSADERKKDQSTSNTNHDHSYMSPEKLNESTNTTNLTVKKLALVKTGRQTCLFTETSNQVNPKNTVKGSGIKAVTLMNEEHMPVQQILVKPTPKSPRKHFKKNILKDIDIQTGTPSNKNHKKIIIKSTNKQVTSRQKVKPAATPNQIEPPPKNTVKRATTTNEEPINTYRSFVKTTQATSPQKVIIKDCGVQRATTTNEKPIQITQQIIFKSTPNHDMQPPQKIIAKNFGVKTATTNPISIPKTSTLNPSISLLKRSTCNEESSVQKLVFKIEAATSSGKRHYILSKSPPQDDFVARAIHSTLAKESTEPQRIFLVKANEEIQSTKVLPQSHVKSDTLKIPNSISYTQTVLIKTLNSQGELQSFLVPKITHSTIDKDPKCVTVRKEISFKPSLKTPNIPEGTKRIMTRREQSVGPKRPDVAEIIIRKENSTGQKIRNIPEVAEKILIRKEHSIGHKRPNILEVSTLPHEFTKSQQFSIAGIGKEFKDYSIVKYPCSHCSKLLDLRSLNQHIRLNHLHCGICGGTFDNIMYLQKHYQTCSLTSFKCWICDKIVANTIEFKLHMSTLHIDSPDNRPYKALTVIHELFDWSSISDSCPYCLKILSRFSDVKFHFKIDHELIPCEKCSSFKFEHQNCRQCL